jgi:hypothetical protein
MDLLERKKIATHKEWNKIMQERIIKNSPFTKDKK